MSIEKGQISTEYLIVVGFVIFVIVSILGIGYLYSGKIEDKIKANQLESFANKLISSAESVYFSGEPSKLTINAYLPSGVEKIDILEKEILFEVTTTSGLNKISYSSDVPLSGAITNSEGVKRIVITAGADRIIFSEG